MNNTPPNITVVYTKCVHNRSDAHTEFAVGAFNGLINCEGGKEIWLLNGDIRVEPCETCKGSGTHYEQHGIYTETLGCHDCNGLGYTHPEGTKITEWCEIHQDMEHRGICRFVPVAITPQGEEQ